MIGDILLEQHVDIREILLKQACAAEIAQTKDTARPQG